MSAHPPHGPTPSGITGPGAPHGPRAETGVPTPNGSSEAAAAGEAADSDGPPRDGRDGAGGRGSRPAPHPLLVVVDPAARRSDGESVRIAQDVLCAGAPVKLCFPQNAEDLARALARRGQRRPVVIGDDRAMLCAVRLLHQASGLTDGPLSVVPVGGAAAIAVARSLGVPTDAVEAARAVLAGREERLDLLVDDGGEVVLGTLRITAGSAVTAPRPDPAPMLVTDARWWVPPLRAFRTLVRTVRPASAPTGRRPAPTGALDGPADPDAPEAAEPGAGADAEAVPGVRRPSGQRLRVEADGVLLTDPDRPVEQVSLSAEGGLADVVVRPRSACAPVRAQAHAVTVSAVSGADFRYRAAAVEAGGPVRARTWTVLPAALRLTVPADRPESRSGARSGSR